MRKDELGDTAKEQRLRKGCRAMEVSPDQAGKVRNKTHPVKLISLPSLQQKPGTSRFMISDEKGGVKG